MCPLVCRFFRPSVSGSSFFVPLLVGLFVGGSVVLDGWSVGQSDIQSIGTRVGQSAIQSSHYHLAMYVYRFAVKSSAWYSPPFVHHYIVFCDVSVITRLSMVSFKDLLLMWCGYDAP